MPLTKTILLQEHWNDKQTANLWPTAPAARVWLHSWLLPPDARCAIIPRNKISHHR
jgi:hypothetical protein